MLAMLADPDILTPLLDDAELLSTRAEPHRLVLTLACRRCGPAGEALPPVELSLVGVRAMAVRYDGVAIDARPSAVRVPAEARVAGLSPWRLGAAVTFALNSLHDDDDLRFAAELDWLAGGPGAYRASRVRLRVLPAPRPAWPDLVVDAWIGADAISASSGGQALDFAQWADEYDAWWLAWAADLDGDSALPDGWRECAVPLAGGRPDLDQGPPAGVPFATGPTDCPAPLLAPLRAWHEGHVAQDWRAMAEAFPHLDRTVEVHAAGIRSDCLGVAFGRWGYVHHVVSWWIEGGRAGVVLAGDEHTLSGAGPATSPVLWRYALRRRAGRWTIHGVRIEDEPAAAGEGTSLAPPVADPERDAQ